jgi:hypothetical protein
MSHVLYLIGMTAAWTALAALALFICALIWMLLGLDRWN